MRNSFTNATHNEEFARNGYVLVKNAVPKGDLEAIFPHDYPAFIGYRKHHFTSHDTDDAATKTRVIEDIRKVLDTHTTSYLDRYKAVVSSFHVKTPGKRSKLKIHQNPTFVDESKFSSIVCWAPLQDVSVSNGTMFIIPGTQRLFPTYRIANFTEESYLERIESKLIRKHKEVMEMKVGDLLFFDDAVFHGSFPNRSDAVRICIAQVLIPEEAPLWTCHKEASKVRVMEVPDDYYERMSEKSYRESLPDLSLVTELTDANDGRKLKYKEFRAAYDRHFERIDLATAGE